MKKALSTLLFCIAVFAFTAQYWAAQSQVTALTETGPHDCSDILIKHEQHPRTGCILQFTLQAAPVPCAGKSKITVSPPSGGIPPYTYSLNGGVYQTSRVLIVTQSGYHGVSVKDATGCQINQNIYVNVIPKLNSVLTISNIECGGDATGTAHAVPIGGTPPYTYEWRRNNTTVGYGQTITGLTAGRYKLVLLDAQNCKHNQYFSLTQPPPLLLSLISVTPQGANYKVKLRGKGGFYDPISRVYQRCDTDGSNCMPSQNSPTFENTPAGIYRFTLTDPGNCADTIIVQVPTGIQGPLSETRENTSLLSTNTEMQVTISPNPADDFVRVDVRATSSGDCWFLLNDPQGRLLQKLEVSEGESFSKSLKTSDLPAGIYTLTVSNAIGSVARRLVVGH